MPILANITTYRSKSFDTSTVHSIHMERPISDFKNLIKDSHSNNSQWFIRNNFKLIVFRASTLVDDMRESG